MEELGLCFLLLAPVDPAWWRRVLRCTPEFSSYDARRAARQALTMPITAADRY